MKIVYLELDMYTYAETPELRAFIEEVDKGGSEVSVNYNRRYSEELYTDILYVTTTDEYIKERHLEEAYKEDYFLDPNNPADYDYIKENFPEYNPNLIGTDENGKILQTVQRSETW